MKLNANIVGLAFGDTETTGLSFIETNVIEVAFILDDPYCNTLDNFDIKINLPKSYVWTKGAESIHGISEETARTHGVTQKEAIHRIDSMFKATYGDNIAKVKLVGANSFFDFVMLQNMYEKNNAGCVPFSYRQIDVNQLGLCVGAGNCLKDICNYYNIEVDESKTHRAAYDARLHRAAFKKLLGDLPIC